MIRAVDRVRSVVPDILYAIAGAGEERQPSKPLSPPRDSDHMYSSWARSTTKRFFVATGNATFLFYRTDKSAPI